jgi:hypothetical protein
MAGQQTKHQLMLARCRRMRLAAKEPSSTEREASPEAPQGEADNREDVRLEAVATAGLISCRH